jgi:putative resolvase
MELHLHTLWLRPWKGRLVVSASQVLWGISLVDVPEGQEAEAMLYTWVFLADHQVDLDRQVVQLPTFSVELELWVTKVLAEVGSGLNGHRKGLMVRLRCPEYKILVVKQHYRLAWFKLKHIEPC